MSRQFLDVYGVESPDEFHDAISHVHLAKIPEVVRTDEKSASSAHRVQIEIS